VAAIDEHLRTCEACQRYLDQLRATIAALGTMPLPTLPGGIVDALLDAFRRGLGPTS
jgi:hypothetical protein